MFSVFQSKVKELRTKIEESKFQWLFNLLSILFFTTMINLFVFLLQITGFRETMEKLLQRPLVFLLNFVPILLGILFFYGITSSIGWAVKINFLLFSVLAIINRTKIIYRDEPLTAFDLFLGVEALTMTVKNNYKPEWNLILYVVVGFVMLTVFFYFYGKQKRSLKIRAAYVVLAICLAFLLQKYVYYNDTLSSSLPVDGSIFNEKDNYTSKGFVYSIVRSTKFISIDIPKNYKAGEFKNISKNTNPQKKLPNVVMIMGEAFHDLSENPLLHFEDDPISNFKEIRKEAILYGRLMTPTFAGGTADTEFEVLSGMMTDRIAPSRTFSYNAVHFPVDSIVQNFLEAGYYTRGFHPGEPWFYKRSSVYPRLGFQDSFFLPSVENAVYKGSYLSEEKTYDDFIARLDDSVKQKENPVFDFMVTIQNHGPYFKGKFAEQHPFTSDKPLSQALTECLKSYFVGIKDMDIQLKRLYDYMKASDEPFVLVYWGDHLPGLVDSVKYYEELDFDMDTKTYAGESNFYSTPYMIWANDLAKPLLALPETKEQIFSSHYLGGYTLEILGLDKADPYFVFLNDLRKKLPVLSRHYIFDGDNAYPKDEYNGKHFDDLQKYYRWQYFRITEPYSSVLRNQ